MGLYPCSQDVVIYIVCIRTKNCNCPTPNIVASHESWWLVVFCFHFSILSIWFSYLPLLSPLLFPFFVIYHYIVLSLQWKLYGHTLGTWKRFPFLDLAIYKNGSQYRWFSLDVIAAMLVYRTIEKKSFGNLTLLLCKIRAIICYCFVHQHGRLITWLQTIYRSLPVYLRQLKI